MVRQKGARFIVALVAFLRFSPHAIQLSEMQFSHGDTSVARAAPLVDQTGCNNLLAILVSF
jgi:hypothetical protein